jgi:hypothetical protein
MAVYVHYQTKLNGLGRRLKQVHADSPFPKYGARKRVAEIAQKLFFRVLPKRY